MAGSSLRCGPNNTAGARGLQLGPLVGLDFAPDGSVILADKLTAKQFRLLKIHSSGTVDIVHYNSATANASANAISPLPIVDISGLAVSPGGDIFLADNTQLKILRLSDPGGNPKTNKTTVTEVEDQSVGQVYQFDRHGRHLATRSLMTGQLAYTFHYTAADGPLGRLERIEDPLGSQVTIARDSATNRVLNIQNPFGQRFPVKLNKLGESWSHF